MEWYIIVAIIAGFATVAGVAIYLISRGVMGKRELNLVNNLIDVVESALDVFNREEDSAFYGAAKMVLELVDRAVHVAENAWYHGEISKEERKDYCMEELHKLLGGFEITLTEGQWSVIDSLICAACEKMGHGVELGEIVTIEEVADALAEVEDAEVVEGNVNDEPDVIKVEE